ncbi:MAG: sigma-70 family RNA polymerase sigma factor [Acetobacterales bacterium]
MDASIADALPTYIKSLRRYAMALTRDPMEADDLVQECLKRALTYIKKNHEIRDFRAYLFTILHNVHMDELARNQRSGIHVPIEEDSIMLYYPAPQNTYMACREIPRALSRLPQEQRQVILLVGLEGLSYRAAAEVLGIPIGTVMSRLSRGREALRSMMAPHPDESGDHQFATVDDDAHMHSQRRVASVG